MSLGRFSRWRQNSAPVNRNATATIFVANTRILKYTFSEMDQELLKQPGRGRNACAHATAERITSKFRPLDQNGGDPGTGYRAHWPERASDAAAAGPQCPNLEYK